METNVNELLLKLENHPLVQKVMKEDIEETNALRKMAIDEIEALDKRYADIKKQHEPEIDKINKAVAEYQEKIDDLRMRRARYGRIIQEAYAFTVSNQPKLRGLLRVTYPKKIDEFILAAQRCLNSLGSAPQSHRLTHDGDRYISTDVPAITNAMEYVRSAVKEAEAMKTSDLSGVDVTAKLHDLWANIPSHREIDTIVMHEGQHLWGSGPVMRYTLGSTEPGIPVSSRF